MTDIGRERGWPPMTRTSFDAQRGPNGALLVTDRIETIAERSGFTGEEQMRIAFVRALGIPPREYRERFCLDGMLTSRRPSTWRIVGKLDNESRLRLVTVSTSGLRSLSLRNRKQALSLRVDTLRVHGELLNWAKTARFVGFDTANSLPWPWKKASKTGCPGCPVQRGYRKSK